MMKAMSLLHQRTVALVAACLLFAGAYYQLSLFVSNQNTYFLVGLANAGYGYLSSDWLAQQTDVVPVFSALVSLVHAHSSHWIFYALFSGIAAVYALSLFTIVARLYPTTSRIAQPAAFFALLTLIHAPWVLSPFSGLIPGLRTIQTLAELSTSGLAGQYVLEHYLQPSTFGVLFLTSIALFIYGKEYQAILCAVGAATIHTSLILHTGILTSAYMTTLLLEKRVSRALKIGALAFVLSLPIVIYVANYFLFSDLRTIHSIGQTISAEVRQPHHAKISVWFSRWSCVQLAIIFTGLLLSRQCQRLFTVLAVCTVAVVSLTFLQMISGSLDLALLFPWRSSAWLVPLCTGLLLGNLSKCGHAIIDKIPVKHIREFSSMCVVLLSLLFSVLVCVLGVQKTIMGIGTDVDHGSVASYAKMHSARHQAWLVPLNLERFRLATGLPIFVDWKSFPYRGSEIIEWCDRVQLAKAFYQATDVKGALVALAHIQDHAKITHVIVDADSDYLRTGMWVRRIFGNSKHVVYELDNEKNVAQWNALAEEWRGVARRGDRAMSGSCG